ncbi:MAG: hypothetical protein CME06_07690 [Gemmatimonadetes bacterium]|nr:hypothetical protein [Gemmatimonadota bacterium]
MSAETPVKTAPVPQGVTRSERAVLDDRESGASGTKPFAAIAAITQRELQSTFYSPIAYVVGCIFLLVSGWFFVSQTLTPGHEASMRPLFELMAKVLVFALPILTMRAIADEFASGAIETLMTAPVSDTSVVLGKFMGVLAFYVALLATTVLHWILLAAYTDPMASVVIVGYVGMLLLGALFISIGIFASCCTRYQLLAAIIAMTLLAVLTLLANYGAEYLEQESLRAVCSYVNVFGHFSNFTKGIIDSASLIFFVTGTAFFLFLAVKVLESRRWR